MPVTKLFSESHPVDFVPEGEVLLFSWVDYVLFSLMLVLSALIGVYFGFFGKKQDNTAEYLMGGKTMNILPIAMSLIASHLSGITILGIPAEIYKYGMYYSMCLLTGIICTVVVGTVYLPVFYKLQLMCSFEYLKLRFDYRCQIIASFIYALSMLLYMPLVIYVPALAFSQVTGLSLHFITPITCVICIFYTTVGGLKAVVWTDTLQLAIMMGAMASVLVMGTRSAGGVANILDTAARGDRLGVFDMDLDPSDRTSFWGIVVGMTVGWISYLGVTQSSVQRFLAVPTMTAARRSVLYLCLGLILIKTITCCFGLLLYARYADCDPLKSGKIIRSDQILPYYVMEIAHSCPGLPGLFIAGVFCAALSTMSSGLNTLAGTIYEDFIARFMPPKTTEKRASDIMKLLVVILGTFCTSMVFIVEKLGSVMQLSYSLGGITGGPMLGLFTLGMLFPSANKKGAFYGAISSLMFMAVMVFGSQYYVSQGYHFPTKILSVDGCHAANATLLEANSTVYEPTTQSVDLPPLFFRVSFYYYCLIGATILIVVGLLISWLTGPEEDVNRDYLSPVIYCFLPKNHDRELSLISEPLRKAEAEDARGL